MQLSRLLLIITFLTVILVACTNESEYVENAYEESLTNYEAVIDILIELYPMICLTEEMRDLVLEDFDYFVEIILANAPSQVIFERRFDMTLEQRLVEMREAIYNREPIRSSYARVRAGRYELEIPTESRDFAARYLFSLLEQFSTNFTAGNFRPPSFPRYLWMLTEMKAALHQAEIIDDLLVIDVENWFGGARFTQLQIDAFTAEQTLWFYGVDLDLDEIDLYFDFNDTTNHFHDPNNVETEIIEENRIARFSLRHFYNRPIIDSEILFPFFEEIQDFEHLIIDLRANDGGAVHYFPNYIVAMLIDEPIEVRKNEFFMAGEHSRQLAEYSRTSWFFGSADEILIAADFVNEHDFPYFNEADLDILAYVIPWKLEITPREDNIPFGGKIWMLVNGVSISGAELAAYIAIDSGFATVVGSPTARHAPTMRTYVSLPNTGILYRINAGYTIDAYGRSLEEFGVTPQIFVPRGQDSLEEVLNLIDSE